MDYLNYLKTTPIDNQQVISSTRGLPKSVSKQPENKIPNQTHSKDSINQINKSISSIGNNIMGVQLPSDLGGDILKNSTLNDILDYSDYQELLMDIKKFITKQYGDIWYAKELESLNLYSYLLSEVTGIINNIFPSNKTFDISNYREDIIFEKLANLYFGIFLIFLHESDEMSIYSLLNSYIKLSEDPNFQRDKGIIFNNAWDTLVLPISIKQHHLVLIKLLDFWFGIGGTWEILKKRIKIKLLKESETLK